jgi:hypothetical protein
MSRYAPPPAPKTDMSALAVIFKLGDQVVIRASGSDSDVGTVTAFKRGGSYIDEHEKIKPFYLVDVKFWSDPEANFTFWNYEIAHAQV